MPLTHLCRNAAILLIVVCSIVFKAVGQSNDFPSPVNPPRLVNDFAGFLSGDEQRMLEQKLVAINDSSTTQIAIVIVKSLNGYDKSDYAARLGDKWGIGQKGKNNGILILVKPKTSQEKGEVFIATGYGAESVITDALCRRIVDKEILPAFENGSYYRGLNNAVNVLYGFLRGEYKPDQYMKSGNRRENNKFPVAIVVIIIILFISFFSRKSGGSQNLSSGGSLPFWLLMGSMMGGGRSSGGGFGDFNSGGGSFGGFGGGSFGGGGSGGSW